MRGSRKGTCNEEILKVKQQKFSQIRCRAKKEQKELRALMGQRLRVKSRVQKEEERGLR